MRINKERHLTIISAGLNGQSAESIGLDLGVSKERVCQILRKYNIDTRKIRQETRKEKYKVLASEVNSLLKNGSSIQEVRKTLKLNPQTINELSKIGVNLKIVNKEDINKRNKKCLSLYKKGLTAYEIIDLVSEVNTPNQVYKNICTINNSTLPKRVSSRDKKNVKLTKEIIRLKKRNSFEDVTKILNEKGVTNLNNGKLKVGTVINRYYNNLK